MIRRNITFGIFGSLFTGLCKPALSEVNSESHNLLADRIGELTWSELTLILNRISGYPDGDGENKDVSPLHKIKIRDLHYSGQSEDIDTYRIRIPGSDSSFIEEDLDHWYLGISFRVPNPAPGIIEPPRDAEHRPDLAKYPEFLARKPPRSEACFLEERTHEDSERAKYFGYKKTLADSETM